MRTHSAIRLRRGQKCFISLKILCSTRIAVSYVAEVPLIEVQPQVFDLLEYLVTNRDRVVSKDDILQAVWGGRIVSESALTTRINAIRTAVGDDGDQQRLIRTLPRKGIRFVGVVQERARPVDEAATTPAAVDAKTPEQKTAHRDEAVPAERRQLTIASCELLLGAAAAGMDPEDLREIIQGYHHCVVETAPAAQRTCRQHARQHSCRLFWLSSRARGRPRACGSSGA